MRRRLLRSIFGIVLVTVVALGCPLAIVSWNLVTDGVRNSITVQAEAINAALSQQEVRTGEVDLDLVALAVPTGWRLQYLELGEGGEAVGAAGTDGMLSVSLPSVNGGILILSSPDAELTAKRWQSMGLVAAAVLASIIVGAGVAMVTANRLASPLSELTLRAGRLGAGDFRTVPRRYGIAELDGVARVLDASAQEVAAMLRNERDLGSDVSHQLRTRLTGIQLRLEELSQHPDPVVREEIGQALEQTDRLVGIVHELLVSARSRRAAGAEVLDLGAELAELQRGWRDAFRSAGRPLVVQCPPDIHVRATPVRLREALGVLLDNALGHGQGEVVLRVEERSAASPVLIEVTDEGPGIDAGLVPHIFDRGISGASSSGLGLGLARAFIEADGGRLELRRARPAIFAIFLVNGSRPEASQ